MVTCAQNLAVPEFGDRLRELIRRESRLTIRQFAQQADVSTNTVIRALKMDTPDELHPTTFQAFARGLKMSVDELNRLLSDAGGVMTVGFPLVTLVALNEEAGRTGASPGELVVDLVEEGLAQRRDARERRHLAELAAKQARAGGGRALSGAELERELQREDAAGKRSKRKAQ